MDKMDLCLLTIDVVVKHFEKVIDGFAHKYEKFDMPIINLGVSGMDPDRYAELETVDAFHEYTVVLNKLWMVENNIDEGLLIGIVAHECVHAFQMTKEGLETFPPHRYGYWFDPYEVEARGLERAFEHLVMKKINKQKKKSS